MTPDAKRVLASISVAADLLSEADFSGAIDANRVSRALDILLKLRGDISAALRIPRCDIAEKLDELLGLAHGSLTPGRSPRKRNRRAQ